MTSNQEWTLELLSVEVGGASISVELGEGSELIVAWGPGEEQGALIFPDGEIDSGFGGSTPSPPTDLDRMCASINARRGWRGDR